jgi:hypothetical protein
MAEYDLDSSGNILTKPVMGWSISHVAGAALLLTIRYAVTSPTTKLRALPNRRPNRRERGERLFALEYQGRPQCGEPSLFPPFGDHVPICRCDGPYQGPRGSRLHRPRY